MKKIVLCLLVLLCPVFIIQCKSPERNNSRQNQPIVIGAITPLTGNYLIYGRYLRQASDMITEKVNSQGGVNGRQVEIRFEDSQHNPKKAVDAYHSLLGQGVQYYILQGSAVAAPVGPLVGKDNLWSIVALAITAAYTDNNPLTCRIALTAPNYAAKITEYVTEQYAHPRVAFLISNTEEGKSLEQKIEAILKENNGQVITSQRFEITNTDFRSHITKIKGLEEEIDIIITHNPGGTAENMFKQIREHDLNLAIISDNWTALNSEINDKSLLEGVIFADYDYNAEPQEDDAELLAEFKQDYFDRYGEYPLVSVVNMYDSINILLHALANSEDQSPHAISDYLINQMKEYHGLSGRITFNQDCEAERDMALRVIEDGVIKKLD